MQFHVNLTAEGFADDFHRLQPWAQASLEKALVDAATDPHQLPPLHTDSKLDRVLGFADGRGICLVTLDEQTRTMTVRIIEAPR